MEIHFKRLTPADAALLMQHPVNWLPPYPPETQEPFLSENDHYVFIGHTDTQIVAFLYGYALPPARWKAYVLYSRCGRCSGFSRLRRWQQPDGIRTERAPERKPDL